MPRLDAAHTEVAARGDVGSEGRAAQPQGNWMRNDRNASGPLVLHDSPAMYAAATDPNPLSDGALTPFVPFLDSAV